MPSISENDIKKAFLPFLREFYRFRYEYQAHTEEVSLDNITREGLIADGMLRFTKPDGKPFVCTYEATSADKSEEVKYAINQQYFLWDCIAFGAVCAAALYSFLFITDLVFIGKLPLSGKIGMPIGIAMIGFFIWYFLMPSWKKYRYIYAIEQFRRYHADEQWVALGEDVFPAPTNPYFLELKDQCIYQGVGLAIVYADLQVRLLAAPSRLGVYGGDKKMAHWITDTALYQSMASNVKAASAYQPPVPGVFGKIKNTLMRPVNRYLLMPLQKALGKTAQPATDMYKRFTESYLVQKWVTVFCMLVMLYIGVRGSEQKQMVEATRPSRVYVPDEKTPSSPEHEDGYVLNDHEAPIPFGTTYRTGQREGVPRQETEAADYTNAPQPGQTPASNIWTTADEEEPAPAPKPKTPAPTTETKTSAPKTSAPTTQNLCEKVKKAGGWYIQDNHFSTQENALERVKLLRSKNIQCEALNTSCMGEAGWAVRLGYNQYSESAAREKAAAYANAITKAGLKTGKTLIKKVGKN